MEMPWGKHKGTKISDVPASYLGFVLEDCDGIKPDLREAIKREIRKRFLIGPCHKCFAPACLCSKCANEYQQAANPTLKIASDWLRRMSKRFHPDRGGSTEAMAAVNEGVSVLNELLAE